jgi:phosphatidylserine/phosphatidylglycerophosphate/cardiolipin synthase-like enzyme
MSNMDRDDASTAAVPPPPTAAGSPPALVVTGTPSPIMVWTLTDRGQTAGEVAGRLAAFVAGATSTLDIAVYDFALSASALAPLAAALAEATRRGVQVRLTDNLQYGRPIPVPPPSALEPDQLEALGVPLRAIPGIPDLMHHKYVVRDGAFVWTGSLNWTDDAWDREENVVAVVSSSAVATAFERDFEELWTTGAVQGTGAFDEEPARVGDAMVRTWFSPGRGRKLAHRIATAIGRAERRIRIASPVITAGAILGTLADVAADGKVDLAGVVDATQMHEVMRQWDRDPAAAWKPPALRSLLARAPFAGKASTPWRPGAVHDYMHAKVTVADDIVFLGSYNLSNSGQQNAENVLEIADPALAQRIALFVDDLRRRYPPLEL